MPSMAAVRPNQSALSLGRESFLEHRSIYAQRERLRGAKRNRENRKLAQLCAQVEQTISLALGDAADLRLHDLFVQSVSPGPDAARLLVTVVATSSSDLESLEKMKTALSSARCWLRQQVAADIHRKRTPELTFLVLPRWEDTP